MGRGSWIAVMALMAVVVASCAGAAQADYTAPSFVVNLDEEAGMRWDATVKGILEKYGYHSSFGAIMRYVDSLIPAPIIDLLEPLLAGLVKDLGEYGQEMEGLYNSVVKYYPQAKADNFTLGKVVGMNFIYSATAFCTSIVAQDINGTILHGRNLDYPIPGLQNVTALIEFQQGGATKYYGTAFVGYVGLLTGMKPGVFSVSIDQRDVKYSNPLEGPLLNLYSALEGGKAVGMFIRSALADYTTFDETIQELNTTRLIAPMYLIVGGAKPGQGAVITRNRPHADDSHGVKNGVWSIDPPSAWYRLETNYDHWNAPPKNDDRRDPGNKMMQAIGEAHIDYTSLFSVLSTKPVNNDNTVYTTIMSATTGHYAVTVRQHDDN